MTNIDRAGAGDTGVTAAVEFGGRDKRLAAIRTV